MLFMHSATVSRWPWRERETGPEPPLKRHWRAPTAWLPVAVLVPWLLLSACQISHIEPVEPAPGTPAEGTPDGPGGGSPEAPGGGGPEAPGGVDPEAPGVVPEGPGGVVPEARAVIVQPPELNVPEGGSGRYTVALTAQPTGAVTVTASEASMELTVTPASLEFTVADWQSAQTVTVTAEHDADALADVPVPVMHAASGGGYDDAAQAELRVGVVEDDVSALAVAGGSALEQAGSIGFEVSLSLAGNQEVTVDYATGAVQDTATGGQDYRHSSDTLTFAAGSTTAQTIAVTVHDDTLNEDHELFTMTLRNPAHAVLTGGGAELTATGRIENDDGLPALSIEHARLTEGEGAMRFTVTLAPASGRTVTVHYATADAGAEAATDYTTVTGALTFEAGATTHTISVPVEDDEDDEDDEKFTVTLSSPVRASLAVATAMGTITDNDESAAQPQLTALQVSGGGTMYPPFDPDTHHYALTCSNSTTLEVSAKAAPSGAVLTLLRANSDDNHASTGALEAQAEVNRNDDVAIELSAGGDTVTYVMHCLPPNFPDIRVLKKTADVSDGLMLITPRYDSPNPVRFTAVIDNNGVPRFHRAGGFLFRHYSDGPTIDGEQVRYSAGVAYHEIDLLNRDFEVMRTLRKDVAGTRIDAHDFLFTDDGDYLFNLRIAATRDLSERHDILDSDNNPFGIVDLTDSVLQVMTPGGTERFSWNSWNHLTIHPDCRLRQFPGQYAHLNAFQIVESDGGGDGDIVASFRGCSQVLRIDGTTGAVNWKLGGTEPDTDPNADPNTEYLELVGDAAGEFCGQHHVTLTEWDSVVLFDNGVFCLGPRKAEAPFTRAVEYDISSATQAVFVQAFEQPEGHGYSDVAGSVTVLERNRWLIAWGRQNDVTANLADVPSIVEVDPSTGTTYLELHLSKSGTLAWSYRVYRVPESQITIPLNLP